MSLFFEKNVKFKDCLMIVGRFKISFFLAIITAILFSKSIFEIFRYEWPPICVPILSIGKEVAGDFTADFDTLYYVSIRFDTFADNNYWECVFGTAEPKKCKAITDSISVLWSISNESEIISEGFATGPFRFAAKRKEKSQSRVTYFIGEKGKDYTVKITLKGIVSKLLEANPHLQVEINPGKRKDSYVLGQIFLGLSMILGVIVMITFFVEHHFATKHKKKVSDS